MPKGNCRNPLSIQVCFNLQEKWYMDAGIWGRNPLSIQVCFNVEKQETK